MPVTLYIRSANTTCLNTKLNKSIMDICYRDYYLYVYNVNYSFPAVTENAKLQAERPTEAALPKSETNQEAV